MRRYIVSTYRKADKRRLLATLGLALTLLAMVGVSASCAAARDTSSTAASSALRSLEFPEAGSPEKWAAELTQLHYQQSPGDKPGVQMWTKPGALTVVVDTNKVGGHYALYQVIVNGKDRRWACVTLGDEPVNLAISYSQQLVWRIDDGAAKVNAPFGIPEARDDRVNCFEMR